MRTGALVFVLLGLASPAAFAETKTDAFAGREWSLEVPAGYREERPAQSPPRSSVTAFAPEPREDGTRPMVMVSLLDVDVPADIDPRELLEPLSAQMIAAVERRREEWQVEKTRIDDGPRRLIRYAWSGVSIPAADGAKQRAPMRGVMLVGIEAGIAFTLHTQDVAAFADETLPANEQVLRTFRIRKIEAQRP